MHPQTNQSHYTMGRKYVITGINVLTGNREELGYPTDQEEAENRYARLLLNYSSMKHRPYRKIRIEAADAVQLTFQFTPND